MIPADRSPVPDEAALMAYIDSAAVILGFSIEAAWREPVLFHLKTITQAAFLMDSYPLPEALEPAPVFEA